MVDLALPQSICLIVLTGKNNYLTEICSGSAGEAGVDGPACGGGPPAFAACAQGERESLLDLLRRTVNLRLPERARHEASTGPKRLDDTRSGVHASARASCTPLSQLSEWDASSCSIAFMCTTRRRVPASASTNLIRTSIHHGYNST